MKKINLFNKIIKKQENKIINTLENKIETLEDILKEELYNNFCDLVNAKEENIRLREENKRLRKTSKKLKEELKNGIKKVSKK